MIRAARLLLIFTLLLFSFSLNAKSFLWKAQSDQSVVYLFGSIHFAKPDMYPLKAEIEQAFASSSSLTVEINANNIDPRAMQTQILKHGVYPQGDSLKQHVDKETIALLEAFLKTQNLPLEAFLSNKPGFLAMTLTIMKMVNMGYLPDYGLDLYFIKKAEKKKMKIHELESTEEQLKLFFELPLQEQFLKITLQEFSQMEQQVESMVKAWKEGDSKTLEKFVIDEPNQKNPELKPVYDLMFTERNIKMTQKIEKYLKTPDTYFVVVGAGHLIGKDGIVAMLRQKGYKVEQL